MTRSISIGSVPEMHTGNINKRMKEYSCTRLWMCRICEELNLALQPSDEQTQQHEWQSKELKTTSQIIAVAFTSH